MVSVLRRFESLLTQAKHKLIHSFDIDIGRFGKIL